MTPPTSELDRSADNPKFAWLDMDMEPYFRIASSMELVMKKARAERAEVLSDFSIDFR